VKYCDKLGHWVKNCRKKKSDAKKKAKEAGSSGPKLNAPSTSTLNVVANDEESNVSFFCYLGATENWLLDSGATDHMTPFRSDFSDYASYSNSSKSVILGDGSTKLVVLGKGSVTCYVETSPQNYCRLTLMDVLHIKGINCQFFSLPKLDDKGFDYHKEKEHILFTKGNTRFSAVRQGNVFFTYLHQEKPLSAHTLSAVESVLIKTLHEHMGHLNWDALKCLNIDSSPPPLSLGAEGVIPGRYIVSLLRVFKQFTHTLPSR